MGSCFIAANTNPKKLKDERDHITTADIIILGGSAAGITAAITARRHHPDKRILLVRMEKQVQIPCGIPYIFGTLGTPEKNLIPDAVLETNRIDPLIAEATKIDRQQTGWKRVTGMSGTNG